MSLDPKTNRQEREAERTTKQAETPPLNPPFPPKRQPFDPLLFSLERETFDEEAERKAAL